MLRGTHKQKTLPLEPGLDLDLRGQSASYPALSSATISVSGAFKGRGKMRPPALPAPLWGPARPPPLLPSSSTLLTPPFAALQKVGRDVSITTFCKFSSKG